MGTILTYLVAVVAVAAALYGISLVVFGRGEELPPMPPDRAPLELPEPGQLQPADIETIRLPVGVRGYRMAEVDWVLQRLAEELVERDRQITVLARDAAGEAPLLEETGPISESATDPSTGSIG